MLLALLDGSLARHVFCLFWSLPQLTLSSSRVLVSKSRTLTFLVSITLLPSTVGIKTGSATRTVLLPSMVIDGSESGHSSSPIVLLRAGKLYRCHDLNLWWSFHFYRQGSASVFQITMHKNLNAFHRIEGVPNHASIHVKLDKEPSSVVYFFIVRAINHLLLFFFPRLIEWMDGVRKECSKFTYTFLILDVLEDARSRYDTLTLE